MVKIRWNEQFSLGIPQFDERNKELIELLNKMIEYTNEAIDSNVISQLIEQTISYALIQFEEEEEYLQTMACPDISMQKHQHDSFKKRMYQFRLDAIEKKDNFSQEICEFLIDWLAFHVLYRDKQSLSSLEVSV